MSVVCENQQHHNASRWILYEIDRDFTKRHFSVIFNQRLWENRSHLAGMAANIITSTGSYRTIDSPVLV
jgi:hypothetical protein